MSVWSDATPSFSASTARGATTSNILSLVAEGGAGKSALVNEWLKRLRAKGYRGATIVLGWSFFSQGSKERATSADEFLNWALAKLGATVATTSASAKGEAIAEALTSRRIASARWRRAVAARTWSAKRPTQGPGLARAAAPLRRTPAGGEPQPDRADQPVAVADIRRFEDDAAPVVEVDPPVGGGGR